MAALETGPTFTITVSYAAWNMEGKKKTSPFGMTLSATQSTNMRSVGVSVEEGERVWEREGKCEGECGGGRESVGKK